ncbi:unnamed protein product [Gongylonema pulchrum]|uniref:DUF4064 domain-containing protein n=1 Tax=Gongylonema pulchrum TaxID=637853 RepID=A0A183ER13_9BILA|nr:unnamed protein product [Gongylonema pulchrum]
MFCAIAFIQMLIGLAVIALTLWLRLDPKFEEDMRANILRTENGHPAMDSVKMNIRLGVRLFLMVSFWVLCGCGLAAALIGLLGTCAAVSANRAVLILFIITAILLILVEIGIGVFVFLYNSTVI